MPTPLVAVNGGGQMKSAAFRSVYDIARVNAFEFGARADCTEQGVGTDVIQAIADATTYALATYGDGATVYLPSGRYRGATSAVIDLQGKCQVKFDFDGTITPDDTAMTMLTFRNGLDMRLRAHLFEGGVFVGFGEDDPYIVDYHTVADVVGGGGQEAFRIEGVFGCRLDLTAYGYAGRVLRTTERVDEEHPQTGAMSGRIETGRNLDFSKARTAQAVWADPGVTVGLGNWGQLDRLTADFDYFGPVWVDLNDVEPSIIDGAYGLSGPTFRGCQVLIGDHWYVGDIDGTTTGRHIIIEESANRSSSAIDVRKMKFLNRGTGLYLNGVSDIKAGLSYAAGESLAFLSVLDGNNVKNAEFFVTANGYGERLVALSGAETDNVVITPVGRDFLGTDDIVDVAANVGGTVKINDAILPYAASGKARIAVGGTGLVSVSNPLFSGNSGNLFNITEAGNNVRVKNGDKLDSATNYQAQTPAIVNNVTGLTNVP